MTVVLIPVVIIMVLLLVSIPVFLGIFVYQDAKARGMEPLLWALIAVFAPGFIGLIIYLVARRDHVTLRCPQCGGEVQENFVSCPVCGQKLSASCGQCGTALRPEWKLCPTCGSEITETTPFTPPIVSSPPGSRKLVYWVIAVILLPVLVFLVAGVAGLVMFTATGGKSYDVSFTDDVQMLIAREFMEGADYHEYRMMTVSAADLGREANDWIAQCQKGKTGVYSRTFLRSENGTFDASLGGGSYEMAYARTVIVIQPDNGVKYLPYCEEYGREGSETWLLTQDIVQEFTDPAIMEDASKAERASAVKRAKKYNNVFVIEYPVGYSIDYRFAVGKSYGLSATTDDESMEIILHDGRVTKNGTAAYDTQYTIPCDANNEGCYIPLKKVS